MHPCHEASPPEAIPPMLPSEFRGCSSFCAAIAPTVRRMVDVILPVLDEALALPWVLGRMPAGGRAIVVLSLIHI